MGAFFLPPLVAARYTTVMEPKPLTETNPYLCDPEVVSRIIREDVRQSSIFEGAKGLPRDTNQPGSADLRRSMVSRKKSVSKS